MVDRKDCPMRHENGNCLPAGGFCTAVNDSICEALHNAYRHGESDERDCLVLSMMDANAKYQERQLKILRNIHKRVTEDTVPVVRCKDCKHYNERNEDCDHPVLWVEYCSDFGLDMKPDDFCSHGERREGE